MKFDFGGYATKSNLKCTDGVTIRPGAFSDSDGEIVPFVWQHLHDDPSNVLGKAFLQHRDDGVYAYIQLNETEKAKIARELVRHGDVNSMSIYATKIEKSGNVVTHGAIKEVSLVLAGANPGAKIESLSIAHSDGHYEEITDEVVIRHSGEIDEYASLDLDVELYDQNGTPIAHADDKKDSEASGESIEDIFNTLTEKQKNAVYAIIGAVASEMDEDDEEEEETTVTEKKVVKQSDQGGNEMRFNAFEKQAGSPEVKKDVLSHSDIEKVAKMTFDECKNGRVNFKDALAHAAATYGIENIELLFPDAQSITKEPQFVRRRSEWVTTVLNGTAHTPFSRIRSRFADITADEARARGYTKGGKKIEEVFPVMQRVTTPQTIYKKQKLDRDDIIDITDFNVVAWLRAEMRIMWEEELARSVLIGDGRLVTSPDKIKEEHIRPIWTDDPFYSYKLQLGASMTNSDLADAFVRSRLYYEGSGRPVTFMSPETVTELMLEKDKDGYRLYKTEAELADALRVSKIIEVPLFYGQKRTVTDPTKADTSKIYALDAIIVNLSDYTIGADKGGQASWAEDFDIDYNQYKYLYEGRCSGALTAYHSAVVIEHEVTASAAAASLNGRAR